MKKLMLILAIVMSSGFLSVRAQKGYAYRPPVIVHNYYPAYSFGMGWGYYPYPYGYYPSYYRSAVPKPSKLDQQIADINHNYDQKIESVKMDKSLPKKERKAEVKALKKERDDKIDVAKKNYYKQS